MLAQPRLVGDDVQQRCRAREIGIACGDRVVDSRVLVAGEVERAAVGDAVPQARANGARREAAQQRLEDAVPGRAGDHVVERGVGSDEVVRVVACGDHAVELPAQRSENLLVRSLRGHRRGLGLEHPAHLEKLEHRPALEKTGGGERGLEQLARLEAADVRAVPLPDLEHARE